MTFDEALRFKRLFKTAKINFDGLEFDILIVPNHREDFKRYCNHYQKGEFVDQSAQQFCSDEKFQLMAIHSEEKWIEYKKIG
jgi:hypothetical protein